MVVEADNLKKETIPITLKIEILYVSFLLNNLGEVTEKHFVPHSYISDVFLNTIYIVLHTYVSNNTVFNFDKFVIECNTRNELVTEDIVADIKNRYEKNIDFDFIVKNLKLNNFKSENRELLEKIFDGLDSYSEKNIVEVRQNLKELDRNLLKLNDKQLLKNSTALTNNYRKILIARRRGVWKRTMGFNCLDARITKPAHDKQITLLIAPTAGLKSTFTKGIENQLLEKNVPILSINPEMDEEQTMDRFACFRGDIHFADIINGGRRREVRVKLDSMLSTFKSFNNYLFVDEPVLNLDDVNDLVIQAKEHFRDIGVLGKEDDYIFLSIDLLSMLRDFRNADYKKITDGMDDFFTIIKEQGIHGLGILQANDNKIRGKMIHIKKPDDVNKLKIGLEDVHGGNTWNHRARVIMSITRPVELKKRFFPERLEEWNLEPDILNIHGIKQNEGGIFFLQFVFNRFNYRLFPYEKVEQEIEDVEYEEESDELL